MKDSEAIRLAKVMSETSYLVSQTITNREWYLSHGKDYEAILARRKEDHVKATNAYVAYKEGN